MYAKVSKRAHSTRGKLRGFDYPYGRSSFKHIVRLTSADFHIIEVLLAIPWRSAQHRLRDLVHFRTFPSRECFCIIVLVFPSRECFFLVSTHPFGRYTCWVLDCPCSLKPIGKRPLTLTFYFQLVDQYQPIALSGIHWWQSIKRSMGGQIITPGSVVYLFVGWTAPGLSLRGSIEPRWLILYLFVD